MSLHPLDPDIATSARTRLLKILEALDERIAIAKNGQPVVATGDVDRFADVDETEGTVLADAGAGRPPVPH